MNEIDTSKVHWNSFICFDCAKKHCINPNPNHAYTVQMDNLCEVCGETKNTTQVRDFGGLKVLGRKEASQNAQKEI